MKACKNCKHYFNPFMVPAMPREPFPWCTHPARKTPDPVYGTVPNSRNCNAARKDESDCCGPDGRAYEPSLRHRAISAVYRVAGAHCV